MQVHDGQNVDAPLGRLKEDAVGKGADQTAAHSQAEFATPLGVIASTRNGRLYLDHEPISQLKADFIVAAGGFQVFDLGGGMEIVVHTSGSGFARAPEPPFPALV